jgi:hypothetical protein
MFVQCVEPVLTIAAALGGKSPFISPIQGSEKDDAFRSHQRFLVSYYHDEPQPLSGSVGVGAGSHSSAEAAPVPVNCYSDHLALVNAYNQWRHILQTQGAAAAYRFCQDRHLAPNVLKDIHALREQFRAYLRQTGFVGRGGGGRYTGAGKESSADSGGDGGGGEEEDNERGELDFSEDESEEADAGDSKKNADQQGISGNLADAAGADSPTLSARVVDNLVRCVLCAGLYPQIVRLGRFRAADNKQPRSGGRSAPVVEVIKLLQADRTELSLHPSSLLCRCVCVAHTAFFAEFLPVSVYLCLQLHEGNSGPCTGCHRGRRSEHYGPRHVPLRPELNPL